MLTDPKLRSQVDALWDKFWTGGLTKGGERVYQTSGIPFIRSQNVHMNQFAFDGLAYISSEQDSALKQSRVQQGDVLLNITGASIGRVCVVPKDLCPANVNQHVCIIRSDGNFDPYFLALYLSTPQVQQSIIENQSGATRQALTKEGIENFEIPLPPLTEQKRIASLLARADRLRSLRRTAHELGESLLQSVFLEMFGNALTGNNPKIPLVPLETLCTKITDGTHVTPTYSKAACHLFQSRT